jgi:hypothetical protein
MYLMLPIKLKMTTPIGDPVDDPPVGASTQNRSWVFCQGMENQSIDQKNGHLNIVSIAAVDPFIWLRENTYSSAASVAILTAHNELCGSRSSTIMSHAKAADRQPQLAPAR